MKDVMKENAVKWLKMLVEIPSFSKEEDKTGDLIEQILNAANITTTRDLNNVVAKNKFLVSDFTPSFQLAAELFFHEEIKLEKHTCHYSQALGPLICV